MINGLKAVISNRKWGSSGNNSGGGSNVHTGAVPSVTSGTGGSVGPSGSVSSGGPNLTTASMGGKKNPRHTHVNSSGGGSKTSSMGGGTTGGSSSSAQQQSANSSGLPSDKNSATASSANEPNSTSPLSSIFMGIGSQSNDEQTEMTQLQALLESRGLPPQLFNAIGPRVSHLISRSLSSNSTVTKAQQLLEGLQSADESVQLQAAIEMCQLLVMGNEDTLAGFPSKQVVPALAALLKNGNNYDMMNHACRALTYMMEALPRSTSVVVDAVPALLEKVEIIQCMDVAEQSLTALEMLSKRHHRVLLNSGALPACLLYIDFFSIPAQRSALTIVSNCCLSVSLAELPKVTPNLSNLTEMLLTVTDKRSLECVVVCFARLVDNCQNEKDKLSEIASHGLLRNLQQLLVLTPPVLSNNCVGTVIRMLSLMADKNACLAVELLNNRIQTTVTYLLLGPEAAAPSTTSDNSNSQIDSSTLGSPPNNAPQIDILPKSTQELLDITCLIHNLMPPLPIEKGGLFEIDEILWYSPELTLSSGGGSSSVMPNSSESGNNMGGAGGGSGTCWMWKDKSGNWLSYSKMDNRIIDMAFANGEEEVTLSNLVSSATYTIDFHAMQQINDDTGTVKSITKGKPPASSDQKEVTAMDLSSSGSSGTPSRQQEIGGNNVADKIIVEEDERSTAFQDPELCSSFIISVFGCLYEIYSSSAGQQVKHKTLRTILRMLHMASGEVLKSVLANFSVSSHICHMLSSNDQKVIVSAIQMSYVLMQKLPQIFSIYFKREGVMHQMEKLSHLPVKNELLGIGVNENKEAAMNSPQNLVSTATDMYGNVQKGGRTTLAPDSNMERTDGSCLSLSNESDHSNPFEDHSSTPSFPIVTTPPDESIAINSINPTSLMTFYSHDGTMTDPQPCIDQSYAPDMSTIGNDPAINLVHLAAMSQTAASKKKKPPPIPMTAPSSVSKRSRRAKSDSTQPPDSPSVASPPPTLLPPGPQSILSRAIFGSSSSATSTNSSLQMSTNSPPKSMHLYPTSNFVATALPSSPIAVPSKQSTSPFTAAATNPTKASAPSSSGPSGFFASLKPTRWHSSAKSCSSSNLEKMGPNANRNSSGALSQQSKRDKKKMSAPSIISNTASVNREKIKYWIKQKAQQFLELYTDSMQRYRALSSPSLSDNINDDTLSQLIAATKRLDMRQDGAMMGGSYAFSSTKPLLQQHQLVNSDYSHLPGEQIRNKVQHLRAIADLLIKGDASPFEVLHSGLVNSLYEFLTSETTNAGDQQKCTLNREKRLRAFCHVFLNCPDPEEDILPVGFENPGIFLLSSEQHELLRVKMEKDYPDSGFPGEGCGPVAAPGGVCALKALVTKLILCLHQLEQFSVRITDLQSITGGHMPASAALASLGMSATSGYSSSTSSRPGTAAIKFFNTHQLKCQLQRHPNCKNGSRQWKGGPVKIDPLAQMHAVEKFLIAKGLARDDGHEEDYDSDEEIRDPFFALLGGSSHHHGSSSHQGRHRLKLFIGQNEVPFDWTVYQAIRQFGSGGNITGGSSDKSASNTPPTSSNECSADEEEFSDDGEMAGCQSETSKSRRARTMWVKTHTIYYASIDECNPACTSSNALATTAGGGSDGNWFLGGVATGALGGSKKYKHYTSNYLSAATSITTKSSSSKSSRSSEQYWTEGVAPKLPNPLLVAIDEANCIGANVNSSNSSMSNQMPRSKTITSHDPSIEVLLLLRVLHSLNCNWFTFYQVALPRCAITSQDFHSVKIQSKTCRQLQDPLGVMTGNLPNWLVEIGKNFPFLLNFETKVLLFHVTSFDRDRAMLRLQETLAASEGANSSSSTTDSSHSSLQHDSSDRVIPRLERKKRIVTRPGQSAESSSGTAAAAAATTVSGGKDIVPGIMLKEAETLLSDLASSRVVLEIQFRDEVGSGLGPTLEWYTLISHQFMRRDLEMWRSLDEDDMQEHYYHISADNTVQENKKTSQLFVKPNNGLFPRPYGRYVKSSLMNKIKNRFRLLGKFLARTIMDNRMADLPLSIPFYKCLLGMDNCLTAADLEYIDPALFTVYCRLQQLVVRKRQLEADISLNPSSLQLALESLTLDNSTVESLDLTFELPGYNIEMKKGGKDAIVTIHNLEHYLNLLIFWTLKEGVYKQVEAVKEGFESVFPLDHLRFFLPEEMDELLCGASRCEKWNVKEMTDCTKIDHGFTHESQAVKWFLDIVCQYGYKEQRLFLQFVTGSPRLPIGGFRSLTPPLTIVRKTLSNPDESPDDYLPSVMTCVNYFKLPEYSSQEIMAARLRQAISEGQQSFDLS